MKQLIGTCVYGSWHYQELSQKELTLLLTHKISVEPQGFLFKPSPRPHQHPLPKNKTELLKAVGCFRGRERLARGNQHWPPYMEIVWCFNHLDGCTGAKPLHFSIGCANGCGSRKEELEFCFRWQDNTANYRMYLGVPGLEYGKVSTVLRQCRSHLAA